jgi:hypothetical protein
MCIRFEHPTKKNELVWGSPWEAAIARLDLMEGSHGELAREGKEGEGEEGEGTPWGGGGLQDGGVPWDTAQLLLYSVLLPACCVVHEEEEKKEREKEKKGRKRKDKIWKIF